MRRSLILAVSAVLALSTTGCMGSGSGMSMPDPAIYAAALADPSRSAADHDRDLAPFPADTAAKVNARVFAALKPGGAYVIVDHYAVDGTGLASADTLHRIDIAAVKSEVEVIGGDKDIVTRLEASQKISAAIPDARLQVVEGVNHMGFLERAEIYNEAIAGFATSVQRVPESIPVSA